MVATAPFLMLLALAIGGPPAFAQVREVPAHTGWLVDEAGILSAGDRQLIESELAAFNQQTGKQLEALVIKSLEGEAIEAFSIRVAEKWKVGDVKRDDGVLMIVAIDDRRVRIEVGQGLEGELPDVTSSRLIRGVIIPYFKAGRFPEGIRAGLGAIMEALGGDATRVAPTRAIRKGRQSPFMGFLLFIVFFSLFLRTRMGRGRGRNALLWGGLGAGLGGLGGRGGFGGGGFGGFGGGGGGFSGGGSSGSW